MSGTGCLHMRMSPLCVLTLSAVWQECAHAPIRGVVARPELIAHDIYAISHSHIVCLGRLPGSNNAPCSRDRRRRQRVCCVGVVKRVGVRSCNGMRCYVVCRLDYAGLRRAAGPGRMFEVIKYKFIAVFVCGVKVEWIEMRVWIGDEE